MEPRGILRNRSEHAGDAAGEHADFDRQQVIRNTQMNAQLAAQTPSADQARARAAAHANGAPPDHLKWDEINLYQTEQEKAATMKIDEPKTPYEGGFDPHGEYYRDDDDDDAGSIPDFSLGAGEYDGAGDAAQSMNGGSVVRAEARVDAGAGSGTDGEGDDEAPLSAEERHQRFEAMRKAHYHNAANPLKRPE